MDMRGIQWTVRAKLGILAAAVVMGAGGLYTAQESNASKIKGQNLLSLIASMNSTTHDVLVNTTSLHRQVQTVADQLEQLNRQSELLNQQAKTGENLANQLKTQVQLTASGVNLMQHILDRQQVTADRTREIAIRSSQLQDSVNASRAALNRLQDAAQSSLDGSLSLEQKLNALLAEMAVSEDEFKVFGQLKSVLQNLPSLPLQDTLNKSLHDLTGIGNAPPLGLIPNPGPNTLPLPGLNNSLANAGNLLPLGH
jgi:acetylglutamate synthase